MMETASHLINNFINSTKYIVIIKICKIKAFGSKYGEQAMSVVNKHKRALTIKDAINAFL